mgnify:CR=1 FL=1
MARIARLNDDFFVNFDDHCLYSNGCKIVELNKRPLDVLEYLCSYPNCYKKVDDINNYLEEGCLSASAIRGYVYSLRSYHPVLKEIVTSNKSGYKYTGNKIESTDIPKGVQSNDFSEYSLVSFLQKEEQFETDLLKAIMYCSCKWGACTFDETPQNTNTCEGVMALMASRHSSKYLDTIDDAVEYLKQEIIDKGLKSKSLDEETVVPTAMYLYLQKKHYSNSVEKNDTIVDKLWDARTINGWGIYVKKMEKYANIGCTYWAIIGLDGYKSIYDDDFQKYLRSLFKYENTYAYGKTINDVNPRIPSLYATSMMYIIYNLLSDSSKRSIGKRYDPEKAIEYIAENFDNPFYLTEQEGINGVEVDGKISVHTVGWNHMTINYSLTALAIAFDRGYFKINAMHEILKRIEQVVIDNSEINEGRMYWSAPNMALEKGNRGKMIFPTMHLIMGLARIRDSVERIVKNK